jgi:cold shock CspA family protein
MHDGVVASFDDPRGLGVVRDDGGAEYPFHCTAIADGTRAIDEGARIRFEVVPGHMGRWEASRITKA